MAGPNSSFLDPLLSPTHQDNGTPLTRRANINLIGFTVADNPTTDATDITNTGGGGAGSVIALTDHAAFRALSSVADKTVIHFQSPPGTYVYSSSSGAGFADDDNIVLKLTAISTGAAGRAYNAGSSVLPTYAAYRLIGSLGLFTSYTILARASKNDGGGDVFAYDSSDVTSADNDGTILVSGAKRSKRVFSGPLHAEWFGLSAANTAAQNTAAMVAAVTAANALPNGGEVRAPQGKFALIVPSGHASGAFHLVGVSNVTIRGAGRYITTFYDSGSRAADSEIYPTNTGDPGGTSGFFTFEDATNVWFHEVGFQGAGTYIQGDLGRDAVDKKAIYWKSGTVGTTNCGNPDCYFTRIEGEAVYADGSSSHPINGLNGDRCHFKKILSNAWNPGVGAANAGFNMHADDCVVEDCGGSPAQFGGTGTSFSRVRVSNPSGLLYGSTQIIAVNCKDCKIEDPSLDGIVMITGAELISIGFFFDSGTSGCSVRRAKFRNCGILGDAGNRAALISLSASTAGIACTDSVVEDCWAIGCYDANNGAFPNSRFIRVIGTEHVTGVIRRNHVDNAGVSHGLKSAVYVNTGVDESNGLIIGEHTYDSSVTSAFVFNVAPALVGSKIPTGASTNVVQVTAAGSPEGSKTGDPGSLCHDTTNGALYVKATGTGNTGWALLGTSGSEVPTSRTLTATAPITGGGDLSANRSFGFAGTDIAASGAVQALTGVSNAVTVAAGTKVEWSSGGPYVKEGGPFGGGIELGVQSEVIALKDSTANKFIGWFQFNSGNTFYRASGDAAEFAILGDQGSGTALRFVAKAGTTGITLQTDNLYHSTAAGSAKIHANATGVRLGDNAAPTHILEIGGSEIVHEGSFFTWKSSASAPLISQQIATGGNGQIMGLYAQSAAVGGGGNGGQLQLGAGRKDGAGAEGSVVILAGGGIVWTTTSTGVAIKTGTEIKGHLSATATLSFGTITALTSSEQDITVTGAAVGDNCYASPQADPGANASWSAYIKTADKVTVRLTAVATDVTTDRTWRADVWKH